MSEVYAKQARPKAGRASVSVGTGKVEDIVRVDEGSMSSAKPRWLWIIYKEIIGFLMTIVFHSTSQDQEIRS